MSRRLRFALAVFATVPVCVGIARAETDPPGARACAAYAPEAATRARLPVDIVLRVMLAETAGNPRAVSSKGAIGCMQIMPETWSELSSRYRLGADPFDPRMNMIGGALYLAELAARYKFPGAYAAYNAGPGRYERYAAGQATLPAETIAYTARIGRNGYAPILAAPTPSWREAGLFLVRRAPPVDMSTGPIADSDGTRVPGSSMFPLAAKELPPASEAAGR